MDTELRIRFHLGLSFLSMSVCIVTFFVEHWGKGEPPNQYKAIPIAKDKIKDLDYDKCSSVGILRTCVFETCIANVAYGVSTWKLIVALGCLSLVGHILSTLYNTLQLFSDKKLYLYIQMALHLIGVSLYSVTITLYFLTTSGITLDTGFYLAVVAVAISFVAAIYICFSGLKKSNRVAAIGDEPKVKESTM